MAKAKKKAVKKKLIPTPKNKEVSSATGKPKKKARGKSMPKILPQDLKKWKADMQKFKDDVDAGKIVLPEDNPFSLKGHGGRPRMYESTEQFIDRAEQYFVWIQGVKQLKKTEVPADNAKGYLVIEEEIWVRHPEPPTITGFALFMGFAGRQGLSQYKLDKPEFKDIVNYYSALVARGYERNLHEGKAIGSIFALKNIDNWQDRTEVLNDFGEGVVKGFNYIVPEPPKPIPDPRDDENDFTK